MKIQLPGSPLADPFFAAVRRRHPDVDIVLLPPANNAEPAGSTQTAPEVDPTQAPVQAPDRALERALEQALDVLNTSRTQVAAVAEQLWSIATLGTQEPPSILVTIRPETDAGVVRAVAEVAGVSGEPDQGDQGSDPSGLVNDLAGLLEATGWQIVQPSTGLPRVIGHREGLRAVASSAPATGVVRVRVDGPGCRVGRPMATDLIRAEPSRHR
ncbi:MAG: hypothetical protein L0H31_14610 [Nocardioidaceae bacterium]|nr:hypothetical protein [Nocardioidaceae bacterium]